MWINYVLSKCRWVQTRKKNTNNLLVDVYLLAIIISLYNVLQLIQAGLRELEEETGLHIQPTQCEDQQVHILSLWEVSYI